MKVWTDLILPFFLFVVLTSGALFADMSLPFPEISENTKDWISENPSEVTSSNEIKPKENSTQVPSNQNTQVDGQKTTNVSSTESSSQDSVSINSNLEKQSTETSSKLETKTILPNSEKTSLKKKKDKKKEDPSESGYKKGLLRLRENQRTHAKSEFNQSSGQGKSANASKLEDARLTAESSNDAGAITEQIDSEDGKWKAVFEVARALRGNGKILEAETQYLKIITEAPENFQSISLFSLGEMLSSTERKDSARRYLLQLVKLLRKKPELDPKKDQLEKVVTLIARIYGDQGKYEEAENWAKTYLNRLNPDASEDSPFVKELRGILKRRYY
ncbi:tetratricopeptide repeat protein [Leptospira noguchii]|uniref:tetratricopeptide repeat protein n=1 Tax=Leptospira noguchii TaxID=28182 RepID=UPI0007742219|nr:tetratricopeptide repeat protein [Leptospira noguchii]